MSILNKVSNAFFSAFEQTGRRRALAELSMMNDRTLADLGISRSLLSQGVQAWPWKNDTNLNVVATQTNKSKEIKAAIKELQAYNDRDLADLGISRGEIVEVVTNGRAA